MKQKNIFFKSDFKLMLESESGWAVPFQLKFYTNAPSRPFIACFDGSEYKNCHLQEDGRLCIGFDAHGLGLGLLMMQPTFYLNDECYATGVCDEVIPPTPVICQDEDGTNVTIQLTLQGSDTLETIGTLPAYYMAGLTPEEHQALIDATIHAEGAANEADKQAGNAETAARHANEAREQITQTFNEKVTALAQDYADTKTRLADDYTTTKSQLDADYTQKKQTLDADYASVKQQLDSDYTATKSQLDSDYIQKKAALEQDYSNAKAGLKADYDAKTAALAQDYTAKKQALDTAYASAIEGINERMKAIEDDYATNKQAWQEAVTNAVNAANTAATEASRVNVTNNGTILTITGRDGQQHTVDVKGDKGDTGEQGPQGVQGPRGEKGEKGDSVTMFPAVTIFGQPRIQETQMSEFSAANYAQFPFLVDFAGRHWQLDCAITTGADVSQQHNVFDSAFGLAFAFSGGKFVLAMSSNGTSWNLGATSGTHNILANTTYYIRITWDGANYVLAYSTDKVNWTNDITVASAESLASKQIIIGKSLDNAHIFNGSINFAEARLTIANVIVWEGMVEVGTATRMALDMSNIDEAGKQRVNDIVKEGIVGNPNNLNETIKARNLVESLNKVAGYINGDLESVATGIVLEESSNPEWSLLGNVKAIDRVINKYGAIVIDPVNKVYARLSDDDLNTFADGTPWSGTYGEALRHFAPLHYLVKKDEQGRWIAWGSQEELNGHTFAENFVGCYQGSVGADGALHSRPNVNVTTSKTMTAFWDAAQVLGTDWGLMNYVDHQKMILMHLLKFGTANSDNTMGTGLNSDPSGGNWYNYKTGSCAQMGIHTGAMPHVDNNAFKQCHLFGVEGLAGGSWEFRPGIRFDGQRCIVYEGNIVSNTAEGREFLRDAGLNLSASYIKQMALGEHFDVIPTVGGGSASTYWCDGAWSASGGQLLLVGGRSHSGSSCGLSAATSHRGFSYSYSYIGARLSFRGDLHELELVDGARIAALNI